MVLSIIENFTNCVPTADEVFMFADVVDIFIF